MSCEKCDVMYKQIGRLCVSCVNKQRYNELTSMQKVKIANYEKLISEHDPKSILALKELMQLGIDDITTPE